jgi:hypothetical protein
LQVAADQALAQLCDVAVVGELQHSIGRGIGPERLGKQLVLAGEEVEDECGVNPRCARDLADRRPDVAVLAEGGLCGAEDLSARPRGSGPPAAALGSVRHVAERRPVPCASSEV